MVDHACLLLALKGKSIFVSSQHIARFISTLYFSKKPVSSWKVFVNDVRGFGYIMTLRTPWIYQNPVSIFQINFQFTHAFFIQLENVLTSSNNLAIVILMDRSMSNMHMIKMASD